MALHANAWKSNYASESELSSAKSFFKRSHLYVPWKLHTKNNQFSNIEIRHPRWLLFLRVTRTFNTSRQRSKKTNLKLPTHATLCMCELRENTTEGGALKRLAQKSKIFSLSFASQMSARFAVRPLESKLSVNSDKLSPAFKAGWLC